MGSVSVEQTKPWIETPTIHSAPISRAAGCNVFLKLDNLQPSGSFKSRGIGNLVLKASAEADNAASPEADVHFYCSSGGNAGLACVTAAQSVGRRATVVVPVTTPAHMIERLRDLGAEVVATGNNWSEADRYLRETFLSKELPGVRAVYVPPFDHPDIWEGASTMMDEIVTQMRDVHRGARLDGVVCSVGGGGLLIGLLDGIERYYTAHAGGWAARHQAGHIPKVLAIETEGAASLNDSVRAGELVTLDGVSTIATSLGSTRAATRAFEWATRCDATTFACDTVSDAESVLGCAGLLDDARLLVEPACGATVVSAYNGGLRRHFGKGLSDDEWAQRNIVLVVCGGSNINLKMLQDYKDKYGL